MTFRARHGMPPNERGPGITLGGRHLVLGGARSGKSAFGQNLVQNAAKSPV